jgi:hypothetical protein
VSNVVGAELQLQTVRGRVPGGRRHHPGVVDQYVDRSALGAELVREVRHRGERRQIQRPHRGASVGYLLPDAAERRLALARVTHGEKDLPASGGQAGRQAQARRSPPVTTAS